VLRTKIAFLCGLLAAMVPSAALSQESSKTATPGTANLQVTRCALKVNGMICGGCAGMVEKRLLKLEGVRAAKVEFKTGEAQVEFDPKKTTPEKIVAAFNQANSGFRVEKTKSGAE